MKKIFSDDGRWKQNKRGNRVRGNKFQRCGAKTPIGRLRGQRTETDNILYPRRRLLGASPHSVGIYSHALYSHALYSHAYLSRSGPTLLSCAFASMLAALLTLTIVPAQAAPKEMAAKETVQVQTTLSGAGASSKETNLGNLVADAVRQTGSAQVGLVPADEIDGGANIPAGKTDPGKIVSALHYADDPSDTVVVLNLTGAQLLKVAERSVSRAPQPFDGFLQVSGLQIRYAPGQPEGKRVSLVGVGGSEVDAGKTYRVATTRPLAGGSLGYYQIWTNKDIAEDTNVPLAKSLGNYLSTHPVVNSVVEDRISPR